MTRPLRILHTADSHIGADLPARPRHNRPRRGDDLVQSFTRVLERATVEGVDLVLHAGDLFDMPKPSSRAMVEAAMPLMGVAAKGIPVVIVPGNHERSTIPAGVFLSHPNIHIITEPCTLRFRVGKRVLAVSSFPCLRRESARKFPLALEATQWSKTRADLRILAVHQTFDSATCGPVGYRFRVGDDVIAKDAVPAAFDYVAAGHIHKHQSLSSDNGCTVPIVYAGSPDRVSFAEMDEPKGVVVVEEGSRGLTPTFMEHEVRPMVHWPVDVTGRSKNRLREQIEALLSAAPSNALAQLRLSGCANPGALDGLRLTSLSRDLRPDVSLRVSARAVEFATRPVRERTRRSSTTAFSALDASDGGIVRTSVDDLKKLPKGCGVYAMYDGDGKLLYIGKSKTVRTRVRTHLRTTTGGNHFGGWTLQVARVDVRPTDSELEALLIEAELIRALRPPFNRQMRRWTQYTYLCENGKPWSQLDVFAQPQSGRRCFGPFRSVHQARALRDAVAATLGLALCPSPTPTANLLPSLQGADAATLCNRYYLRQCAGPCARRVDEEAYHHRIRQRDELLQGIDDTPLVQLDPSHDAQQVMSWETDLEVAPTREVALLQAAFEHAVMLRRAESLMHGLLVLPGLDGRRKTAILTARGACYDVLEDRAPDAERILARHRSAVKRRERGEDRRLPKTVLDAFCIVVRELQRDTGQVRFIGADKLMTMDAPGLLAEAFEEDGADAQPSTENET